MKELFSTVTSQSEAINHPTNTPAVPPTIRKIRPKIAPITLTENAAKRIKQLLENNEEAIGVKISVKRRGCNGYSYNMNYAKQEDLVANKDELVESHGVKVLVDPKAIFFIVGTVMNFEETDLTAEFTFTNPNSKGECGCGESFNV